MSEKGSVFQKGGGGTNFEQLVQTAFLSNLIIRGNAPGIPQNEITEVAFQTTNKGYETDDLLIIAKSKAGEHRLLGQIKYNLTFSIKNDTFNEVISAFWKDFNNEKIFDKINDRLLFIKSGLNTKERSYIKPLFNWARTHANAVDFFSEINRLKLKRDHLNLFAESLKKANEDEAVSDKDLWEFLKCLDVLEYDLLNETSKDKAYFLNLIKLSKNTGNSRSENDIWNDIHDYVARLNKDGGSVTTESIQNHSIYLDFDLSRVHPHFKSIEKLVSDSEIILKPLKSTIGNFHLSKDDTYQAITESVSQFELTMVTGKPGVGKSAAIKDVLINEFQNATRFVFRADQFNVPHLTQVFTSQGVTEKIQDIFSLLSLTPEKILVIDSLEKLLEGDPENAFKQLLALLKEYPDVRVLATVRRYSVDLIHQKFGIDQSVTNIIEVTTLNKEELDQVAANFPQLQSVFKNDQLSKLLESPKYLDFALSALSKSTEDFSKVSLTEFKEQLWNTLVKNMSNRTKGLPAKREDAFMDVAINRARQMKLFVKPGTVDEEAIDLLENDEIIFQDALTRRYSPSHDILEDWALVKYVAATYEDHPQPNELFNKLGHEPAIRRAFRLWVEDEITHNIDLISKLIQDTLDEKTIPRYWADELMIAVFKSDNCSLFFSTFEQQLLKDKAQFLNRCIHLIRTACKQGNTQMNNSSILLPIGSGWSRAISFIQQHKVALDDLRLSITNLLFDWEYGLLFDKSVEGEEALNVKKLVIHFISQIEEGNEFWEQENTRNIGTRLIELLYNLSYISKTEITDLVDRAFQAKQGRDNWRLHSFYEAVINKTLRGVDTQRITKEIPKLVVETAWKEWKYVIPEKEEGEHSPLGIYMDDSLSSDLCWGIEDKFSFFPSGIYKTPILNLLYAHPTTGLKFIVEFINYSVDFYVNAKCQYKHEIAQIEVELNDGSRIKQWGNLELWLAYRGASVTHYAIESLLMSLEKYLLVLAEMKTETSRMNLQLYFEYLLKESNNVSVSSTLLSVAIAFPEEIGRGFLPLLRSTEFYEWDFSRYMKEHSSLAPYDNDVSFAQKERFESNQLPHRKKYRRGLMDFVLDYQFSIGLLNSEIHEILARLQTQIQPDDLAWKKVLTEIDIRNHKVGEYDESLGGFPVQPEYDEEVSENIRANEEQFKAESVALNFSSLLREAMENNEPMSFKNWSDCFDQYSSGQQFDPVFDRPVTLAVIGLRDFKKELRDNQTKWCLQTFTEAISNIVEAQFQPFDLGKTVSLLERDTALFSIHYVLEYLTTQEDKAEIIYLMTYMLLAPFPQHEIGEIINYVRNTFIKHHPVEGKHIWVNLIQYAKYRKANPYFYDHQDKEALNIIKIKESEFIEGLSLSQHPILELKDIDFDHSEAYLLARAFTITPYYLDDPEYSDFIQHLLPLLIEDLKRKRTYSYGKGPESRRIQPDDELRAQLFLSELLLNNSSTLSHHVIDLLYDSISKPDESFFTIKDLHSFVAQVFEYVVLKLYDLGNTTTEEQEYLEVEQNFWKLWEYLSQRVKVTQSPILLSKLFLNVRFLQGNFHGDPHEESWKMIERNKGRFNSIITEFKDSNISSYLIDLYSTVGNTFLPEGITVLVEVLKNHPTKILVLNSTSAERLVKRLFYHHISTIKSNRVMIENFLWLLDKMVDLGSSKAYLFRENVITYKS